MKIKSTIFVSAMALMASAILATAQDSDATPDAVPDAKPDAKAEGGRGDRSGRFEEFRQRMEERLKGDLKASDEEWTVIKPLLEAVQAKQRESGSGRFGGFGGFSGRRPGGDRGTGGGGAPGTTGTASAASNGAPRGPGGPSQGGSPESQALRAAVANPAASADDLKAKLTAVREQRKKAAAALAKAREDLSKVLTQRQEAVLVSIGILE